MADDSAFKPACLSQFVFYPQQDPDDCGVSVLRMVARYYGLSVSNARIRETSGVPYGELSLLALSRAAKAFGLDSLSLRLRSEELDQLSQWPAIAHTQGQHYVLIEKITTQWVHLSDPAYGRYILTRGEFIERWVEQGRGVLLVLEPNVHFRPALIEDEKPEKSPLGLPSIGFIGLLMVVLQSILLIVFFQLLRSLLQIGSLPAKSLILLGGFSMFSWLAYALVRSRWSSLSKQRVNSWMINLDRQIADRPHSLPEYEWDSERETRWIARSESRRFMRSNAQAYLSGIRGSLQTVILGLYLGWLNLPVGVLFAGFVLGYFVVRKVQAERLMGLAILAFERRISEQFQSWFLDASAEWQLLTSQTVEEDHHALVGESVEKPSGLFWLIPLSWILVLVFLALVSDNAIKSIDVIALVGVIGFYGCYLGLEGLQSSAIRQMLLPGYEGLASSGQDVAPGQKVDELMLVSQDEEEGQQIVFHLPARSAILMFGEDHPSRSLMVNQLAGNASGEDRQLATSSGSFTKGQLSQWRQDRMLIRHSSILPVAPIGELITGQSDYRTDDMELDAVLKDSLLHDLIKGWPQGLDTILAFQPIHSQTLIYQVLVARALYQRPEWLILDEVFRHLDPFQEQVILENLVHARQGLSTIIVSRRLEMAGQVDWIIHTREGAILEEGKFAQLMEDEGYLYSLITSG